MRNRIAKGLKDSADLKLKLLSEGLDEDIEIISRMIISAFEKGSKILLAGNGGSAADAQHIAAEFVGRYLKDRPALPAIALNTDTSCLTAISNDMGYDKVFSRQIEALGTKGDLLWMLSTSGNSENLVEALKTAKSMGVTTVCLLGAGGGKMKGMGDVELIVPSDDTPRIQEAHITVAHLICEAVETAIGGAD
jgi:D-sedoheptulose 7-phosphate isomerase